MTEDRWMLIAAASVGEAVRFAHSQRIEPVSVATGPELLRMGKSARARITSDRVTALMLHSPDWSRQSYPQAYLAALALLPASAKYLGDEKRGAVVRLSTIRMASELALVPFQVAHGLMGAGREIVRFRGGEHGDPPRSPLNPERSVWVLAICPVGSGGHVGGAVSHVSGILGGFRRAGCKVLLLTTAPPADQLRSAVDDVIVTPSLPAGMRISDDVYRICANAVIRGEALGVARSLDPAFVYQRHAPFTVAGADIARTLRIPLVLEWNGSEAWTRLNWELNRLRVERIFDGLSVSMERRVLSQADLVTSVSELASEQAYEAGADRERVLLVPNAVDVETVRPHRGRRKSGRPVLGWIGSFGPWHGAPVLIRAMPLLPDDIHLVMIGNGAEREKCEGLACNLGVSERIEWKGQLPHDEAVATLAECDILVSPHVPIPGVRFFGSPIKLFEYMALGRPIVASRLEQLGEVLEDGRTARLVEPGDVEGLAKGIRDVLGDPEGARAMGQAARKTAERHHTWDARARRILDQLSVRVEGT